MEKGFRKPKQKLSKNSPMGILRCGLINLSSNFSCPISGQVYDYRTTEVIDVVVTDKSGKRHSRAMLVDHHYVDIAIELYTKRIAESGQYTLVSIKVLTPEDLEKEVQS